MKITERQEKILNTIVKEYIDSAWPVSSQLLEKKYDFGISPATIRIEMQKLTETGLLCQLHTSAGRIPTDKGYRFFVNGLIARQSFASQNLGGFEKDYDFKIENWVDEEITDTVKFIQSLTKNLALASSALALSYLPEEGILWKEGWEEILREPEVEEKNFISNFTKLLENFEKNIGDLKINSGVKIYIGRENPFPKAKDFSIICSRFYFPTEKEVVVSLLGPKRMNYDRNIGLINSLAEALAEAFN
ncbi:MAG: hypothetical protein Q8N73_00630 [bacterium]|nr:hypothetical protein [bacterium]